MVLLLALLLCQSAQESIDRGIEKAKAGDTDGALAEFDRALALDPKNVSALYQRGVARESKGDTPGALEDYGRAIEANGSMPEPYYARAKIFEKQGMIDRAEAEYGSLMKAVPGNPSAWVRRGGVRYRRNNLDGALDDYNHALALDPRSLPALYFRGKVHQDRGELDEALADFSTHVELAPRDPWGQQGRGWIKLLKGDFAGALADANRSIELDPEHYYGYELRCRILRMKGEPRKALADAEKMINLNPKLADPWLACGEIRKRLRQLDDARSDFLQAVKLDPKDLWNTYGLALLDFDERRWAEAVRELRQCGSMDPDSQDYVRIRLWIARSRLGERPAATRELREYQEKRPPELWPVQIGGFLAGTLSEEALFEKAGAAKSRKQEGRLLEARYYAAVRHALDGRTAKAVELLKRCLASESRTSFEYDSALYELEALEPGAVDEILVPGAEDIFDRIEDRVHRAKTVRVHFSYEARKLKEQEPMIEAGGTILVKQGNKVAATERFQLEGKVVQKKQISDGSINAFWVGERREDKKTLKNEGRKVLNGILRAGYVQAQLIQVNLIPIDPGGDPGDMDPKWLIPLADFSFGEEESGARTILYRMKDDPNVRLKVLYDPQTLTLLRHTIEFGGADAGTSVERYTEFALDIDIPDETFQIPVEKK
jgi:tetratricopeptide (TPR) repeat protein